jgi:hypothetical protein
MIQKMLLINHLMQAFKTDLIQISHGYIVPQGIGKGLLNLFNNALWACAERIKFHLGQTRLLAHPE